jgi:membrane protein DedA with SNARE-associated domain
MRKAVAAVAFMLGGACLFAVVAVLATLFGDGGDSSDSAYLNEAFWWGLGMLVFVAGGILALREPRDRSH